MCYWPRLSMFDEFTVKKGSRLQNMTYSCVSTKRPMKLSELYII